MVSKGYKQPKVKLILNRNYFNQDGKHRCTHCNGSNHMRENCFTFMGFPEWWTERKRKQQEGRRGKGVIHTVSTSSGVVGDYVECQEQRSGPSPRPNPMEEIVKKLDLTDLVTLMQFMRISMGESTTRPPSLKLEIPPIDLKLNGPTTYLSWSCQVRYTLAGRNLEGFLMGDMVEPVEGATMRDEWKSTHMLVYIWLLNSMITSIAATVDCIEKVKDVWEKLRRTYDGVENNLRVFQIKREIYVAVQRDRIVQEYAIELERLWLEHDHFSPRAGCKDPECKQREALVQERTMLFLPGLAPVYE
jgi:hypothetical protein